MANHGGSNHGLIVRIKDSAGLEGLGEARDWWSLPRAETQKVLKL